ncbi:MAG: hypothetical protein KIT56_07760 [Gammaproteobacteria bacterium]|nr:hypothetical protein [Gammaproteobacteria bacterium]MCW5583756.1 hypothetical protein [Gammaproteobacteria bacterium]
MKNTFLLIMLASLFTLFVGCTTINTERLPHYCFQPRSAWGIATFTNNTDVPQAGTRAMSITTGVLRSRGIAFLATFQPRKNCNELIICPNNSVSLVEVRRFGLEHHIRYMVIGAVNEWQYKVGLDGEPVASVSIQILDVQRNQIVWSSVGSRIGSSHSGLSVTAQDLINDMLSKL